LTVSLIVTTYNRPDALRLVLKSALAQYHLPDEIIIADDGSKETTYKTIEALAIQSPVPLLHVWQQDKGFRAAMIRNRAIAAATGDYIVMIDGDMVLHPYFISDHLDAAETGTFIQGGRVLLTPEATEHAIKQERIIFSPFSSGIKNRKNALHYPLLCRYFCQPNHSMHGIKTCNFALFRSDIHAVNGFDNDFVGWGREDSEFAARLFNAGLTRKNLKFAAIAYHLYHPESPRNSLPENDRRLQHSIDEKRVRCENGIDRFLKESH
jgi:glycosyltransferase involved in cell wall biosynthesis